MHAGSGEGWRGRGGEEETHNKTCVAERAAGLEWKEPAPAERSGDSEERVRPAGRGAARGRSRYQAPASSRVGQGVGAKPGQRTRTSRRVRADRPSGTTASHISRCLNPALRVGRGALPPGRNPSSIRWDLAGAFSPLRPEAGPSPRAPPAAHIWKESEGGWAGEAGGRGRATEIVRGRWNWVGGVDPCT